MKVRTTEQSKTNYVAGASKAPANYKAGILATTDWKAKASSAEAEALYAQKIQESITAKRRQRALEATSDDQWKNAASTNGASVIGQRMVAAADKQSRNVAPYLDALRNTELPARSADPMTNVTQRVGAVVNALVNKKKELKG
jgi:hypothetical protein